MKCFARVAIDKHVECQLSGSMRHVMIVIIKLMQVISFSGPARVSLRGTCPPAQPRQQLRSESLEAGRAGPVAELSSHQSVSNCEWRQSE